MIYISYIILGLIIGTIIIHSDAEGLYKQLTRQSAHYDHCGNDVIVFSIIWYYVLWPIPFLFKMWILFWKYVYYGIQHIVMLIANIGAFFKDRLLPELLSALKKKEK